MKRSHLVILVVVLVAGFAAWRYFQPGEDRLAVDLIAEFPKAQERKPAAEVFKVADVAIAGQTKHAISVEPLTGSRIRWRFTVPDNAWLRVSLGIKEEAWTAANTDGVLFAILMQDGAGATDPLLSMTINPAANTNERVWADQLIDLTQYAGETMELVFKTNSSSGRMDNQTGDLAVWGDPRIVIR